MTGIEEAGAAYLLMGAAALVAGAWTAHNISKNQSHQNSSSQNSEAPPAEQSNKAEDKSQALSPGDPKEPCEKCEDDKNNKKNKKSNRRKYMGKTPQKDSKTGREVIERMRSEGKIRGEGDATEFMDKNGDWHPLSEGHMAHVEGKDAVSAWNDGLAETGPRSQEVRDFMLDSKNYYIEYGPINSSEGAQIGRVYRPPSN